MTKRGALILAASLTGFSLVVIGGIAAGILRSRGKSTQPAAGGPTPSAQVNPASNAEAPEPTPTAEMAPPARERREHQDERQGRHRDHDDEHEEDEEDD